MQPVRTSSSATWRMASCFDSARAPVRMFPDSSLSMAGPCLCVRRVRRGLQPQDEEERRSLAGLALHLQPAAVHLHQPLADGKPQAGAAVLLADLIARLGEVVEDVRQPVLLDPDAGVG